VAFGLYHGLSSLARVIGPPLAGWFFTYHVSGPYAVAAGLALVVAGWTALLWVRTRASPATVAVAPVAGGVTGHPVRASDRIQGSTPDPGEAMMNVNHAVFGLVTLLATAAGCENGKAQAPTTAPSSSASDKPVDVPVKLTDADWKSRLTAGQYHILREEGTEPPYRNAYFDNHEKGTYVCAADGKPAVQLRAEYDSGTGWPSFWKPGGRDERDRENGRGRFAHGSRVREMPRPPWARPSTTARSRPACVTCMNSGAMKFVRRGK
jgi:hypothetical protein